MILAALLLAAGYILHLIATPFTGGMKFDLLLSFLFVALLLIPNVRINIQTGILAGLIAALTTSFPGGQIPNLVDKLVVTLILCGLIRLLLPRLPLALTAPIVAVVGTLLSGGVFLATALAITELPAPFMLLYKTVVLPATLANALLTTALAMAVRRAASRFSPRLVGAK
jgi:hypothetical protein